MPDDGQQSSGGGFLGTLKAKWGPLPVWGWLALVTVVLLGYWLYEQHKAGSSTNTNAPTPASVGQPGVVVINQGDTNLPPAATPAATKPPKPPEDHDKDDQGKHRGGHDDDDHHRHRKRRHHAHGQDQDSPRQAAPVGLLPPGGQPGPPGGTPVGTGGAKAGESGSAMGEGNGGAL